MRSLLILFVLLLAVPIDAGQTLLLNGEHIECEIKALAFKEKVISLELVDQQGKSIPSRANQLFRWGKPEPLKRHERILLHDGSQLVADDNWSEEGVFRTRDNAIEIKKNGIWLTFERKHVSSLMFTSSDSISGSPDSDNDTLFLRDGDQLSGKLVSIEADKVLFEAYGSELETSLQRVAGILLAHKAGTEPTPEKTCQVGLADGSLIRATKLSVNGKSLLMSLLGQKKLQIPRGSLSFVQPNNTRVTYLSDLEPVNYQHTPYFDLQRAYTRDRSLDNLLLSLAGRMHIKGLAMPTASRLVFKLDGEPLRFQAEIGVADPPTEADLSGSVNFTVYLVRGGAFEQAFDSGILRSGDTPVSVDINLEGAAAIALVVDFADRGDSGDHALWLDARLVSP